MAYKYQGAKGSGSFAWYFQRVTGVVLFIQVLLHFYIAHKTWDAGHNWETIVQRLSNPYLVTFYLVFVLLGLYHGLNGLWAVIRDYQMKEGVRQTIFGIILVVGISIGVLGILTMVYLPSLR
ncbi:MAG: succinate dehydrogenase, hydrophobic membrane anchor protein [Calditrichia bacterium]